MITQKEGELLAKFFEKVCKETSPDLGYCGFVVFDLQKNINTTYYPDGRPPEIKDMSKHPSPYSFRKNTPPY